MAAKKSPAKSGNNADIQNLSISEILKLIKFSHLIAFVGTLLTALSGSFGLGLKVCEFMHSASLMGEDSGEKLNQELVNVRRQLKMNESTIAELRKITNGQYSSINPNELSNLLAEYEPAIFNGSQEGTYYLGRVIPNTSSLYRDTNFGQELDDIHDSFDMLANTGNFATNFYYNNIIKAVERGVNFRFILSDYRKTNSNYYSFSSAVGEYSADEPYGASLNAHKRLNETIELIASDKRRFPGSITIRWNDRPILYTLWIRDRASQSRIAHIGVHLYEGKDEWPYFRLSNKTSGTLINTLTLEFDNVLNNSFDYNIIKLNE